MRRITICVLLTLAVLCASAPAEEAKAPMPRVRVKLTRLGLVTRADLLLSGACTIVGDTRALLPPASRVTLELREGEICLFAEGIRLAAGREITLLQHGGEGLRFAEGGNRYPGDLTLYADGAQMSAVLSIPVEDYLPGCVAYEMNDLFPAEALKAQAVCARTYALSHRSPGEKWDVVDTANDQVFRGLDSAWQNVSKAVKDTEGLVGMWRGSLAECWYSASNGGQTDLPANVWNKTGDYGYYRMEDDPYDLSNQESPVRRAPIAKDAAELNEALRKKLAEAAYGEMERRGFPRREDAFCAVRVASVRLGEPKYAAPSRLYTALTAEIGWAARRVEEQAVPAGDAGTEEPRIQLRYGEWEPQPDSLTVTLPLFPDLSRALGLSMNGSMDNEMITLTETDKAFVLEARRYGHGVGMSQRGAQQMAKEGKSYTDILAFYYPGMTLAGAGYGAAETATPLPLLAATPAPSASPTPRPTLMPVSKPLPRGAYLATVEGIAEDSSLNLRGGPTLSSEILMRLFPHQPLAVLEVSPDGEWAHVRTDVAEGWVMGSFLQKAK